MALGRLGEGELCSKSSWVTSEILALRRKRENREEKGREGRREGERGWGVRERKEGKERREGRGGKGGGEEGRGGEGRECPYSVGKEQCRREMRKGVKCPQWAYLTIL